jgi:hypothetical protein
MGAPAVFSLSLVPGCPTSRVGQGSARFIKTYGVFFVKKAKLSENFFDGRFVALSNLEEVSHPGHFVGQANYCVHTT